MNYAGKGTVQHFAFAEPSSEPVVRQVWSLLDMLEDLKALIECRDEIQRQRKEFSKEPPDNRLAPHHRTGTIRKLVHWRTVFDKHGFAKASYATYKLANSSLVHQKYADAVRELAEISQDFEADITSRSMYVIAADRTHEYGRGLGKLINKAFPAATEEMREANTCYALDRYTASVFHMMRAVEHGLRAIVVAVGETAPKIPLDYQGWNYLVEKFESNTGKAPNAWPEPSRTNGREFFRRTIADMYSFKDETRNVMMHTRNDPYDQPGALSVRNRVHEFFSRIEEKKVTEHGTATLLNPSLFL